MNIVDDSYLGNSDEVSFISLSYITIFMYHLLLLQEDIQFICFRCRQRYFENGNIKDNADQSSPGVHYPIKIVRSLV